MQKGRNISSESHSFEDDGISPRTLCSTPTSFTINFTQLTSSLVWLWSAKYQPSVGYSQQLPLESGTGPLTKLFGDQAFCSKTQLLKSLLFLLLLSTPDSCNKLKLSPLASIKTMVSQGTSAIALCLSQLKLLFLSSSAKIRSFTSISIKHLSITTQKMHYLLICTSTMINCTISGRTKMVPLNS